MSFTETWLNENIPDSAVELPNFDVVRGDRTLESGKTKGGGVCLYINKGWCNNWTVNDNICTPDYELLTIALRPYYLPREFNQILIMVVYIQPRVNIKIACDAIASRIQKTETVSPDSAKFVLGDFNQCKLDLVLPTYHQFVNKPTRNNAILDLCYGNVPSAYNAKVCPQPGNSDHNNILLQPIYKQQLKRIKPTTKFDQVWFNESIEKLRGCFKCTDWNVLVNLSNSIDTIVTVVTDYIKFCVDSIVPVYPNDKPWASHQLKPLLGEREEKSLHSWTITQGQRDTETTWSADQTE